MKISFWSRLPALALGLILMSAVVLAEPPVNWRDADTSLGFLEKTVTLTSSQRKQAINIFEKLKDKMDAMSPSEVASPRASQILREEIAAIRAILTPEQQAIYDRTPLRLGGGKIGIDPVATALMQRIAGFVSNVVIKSPRIAKQVGTIEAVSVDKRGMEWREQTVVGHKEWPMIAKEKSDDPELHPVSGVATVHVTGSSGAKTFDVYWEMDEAGKMTLNRIEEKE